MKAVRWGARASALAVMLVAGSAQATGFTDVGNDITPREKPEIKLDGYLRTRGEALYNLDLDRGPTPSGATLFPVSKADPSTKMLTYWDMRLRTDIAVYAPGGMVAVKARIDVLDNMALGSVPDGIPSATTTLKPANGALSVKRAYGEALLPFGLLAAGRMGSHWGLGILTNGGDCLDCDSGDAADRIGFLTPIAGHILAAAYDFSATGPQATRGIQGRSVGFEPTTDVRSVTFAFLNFRDEATRARRKKAGKTTIEYGSYLSHRWQSNDVPAAYLPLAQPIPITASQVMARGFHATAIDGWVRFSSPMLRIEAEGVYLNGQVDQASLLPGALLKNPVTSSQVGAALETDIGRVEDAFGFGIDGGYASGDRAPGFGVGTATANGAPAKAGDLNGSQANPPYDNTVNNFRFHPDYRIDRILFREIIGSVTDALYVKPHAKLRLARAASGSLTASVAAIASSAIYGTSTPSGQKPLGIEIDPTLAWDSRDGFHVALEHAILFPLGGFDNPDLHLSAKPAQLLRLRLAYVF